MPSLIRLTRLCRWSLYLLVVAIAGWIVRIGRRLLRVPPRIWHGPNGLHLIKWNVDVDRHIGYPSRSVIRSTRSSYPLFRDQDFDVVLDRTHPNQRDWAVLAFADLLRHGDVWVAFFDSLFFPTGRRRLNEWTLWVLRLVGIRIILAPHGMDVFYLDNRTTRYDWVRRAQADYPAWDLTVQKETAVWRTGLFCRWAWIVIGADSTVNRFLPRRDVIFKWFAVDCESLRPQPAVSRNRPLIIHAPQHPTTKGTDELVAAVDELGRRGIECELRLIEKVSRDEALKLYAEADVVADQFCMGAFGMFALEGLALGKPVLAYLDQEHLGNPVFNIPIVNTTPDNLARVLAVVVALPELRRRLGLAGRAATEKFHSVPAIAEVWDQIYRHVWWGVPLDLEKTAHFSRQRGVRSFTENPADSDFWPVPVADLMPEIRASLDRFSRLAV